MISGIDTVEDEDDVPIFWCAFKVNRTITAVSCSSHMIVLAVSGDSHNIIQPNNQITFFEEMT
jgi:hypothetical protein